MPKQKPADKLTGLREKMKQLAAQAAALEARQKEADRKADTRRKVIAGALAIEHMEANAPSEFGKVMLRLLDEYVTRPADRALFPSLPAKAAANGITQPVAAAFKEAEQQHV
jgi:hypothetical protein